MSFKKGKLLGIIFIAMFLWGCEKTDPVASTSDPVILTSVALDSEVEIVEITASESESIIIKEDATFTLTTNIPVTEAYFKDNLEVSPLVDYTVNMLSDTTYKLVPKAPLAVGSVISMKHSNSTRVAGWAFQVGDSLKVKSTYPSNNAELVPVSTGIEITFNNPIDEGILSFLTIEPAVAYEHKIEGNKITLIPDQLEEDTKYYVRLSKAYKNKFEKTLTEDFESYFITTGQNTTLSYTIMTMTLGYPDEAVYYPMFFSDATEIKAKIYKFKDAVAFNEVLKAYVRDKANYCFPNKRISYESLTKVFEDNVPTVELNNMSQASIPALAEGYYLVQLETEERTYIDFKQVSAYSLYYEASFDHTLIWCLDSISGKPLSDTDILVNGVVKAQTQSDGVAIVEGATPKDFISINTPKGPLLLPVDRKSDWETYYTYESTGFTYNFTDPLIRNQFLYTDRRVYKPSETVQLFGMVRLEDEKKIDEVTVKLLGSLSEPLQTKTIKVNDFGTFSGTLDLPDYESYFCVAVYDEDRFIGDRYIRSSHYSKPEFTISAQIDKKVLGPSESFTLSGEVINFDETPSIAMPLEIKGYCKYYLDRDFDHGTVTTDSNGGFKITHTPKYDYDSSNPFLYETHTANKMAENMDDVMKNQIYIYPSDVVFDVNLVESDTADVLDLIFMTHKLELPLERTGIYDSSAYRGAPLDREIQMTLKESYIEKVEIGTVYDPILKINVKQYEYKENKKTIDVNTVYTKNGYAKLSYPFNPKRTYQLVASLEDVPGHIIWASDLYEKKASYCFSENSPFFTDYKTYALGEKIEEELVFPDDIVRTPQEKVLFIEYRKDYVRHTVSSQPKYVSEFTEEALPNYILKGIYFDGKRFRIGTHTKTKLIGMAESEKQLKIEVDTDQIRYKPGDTLKITVKTSAGGKPVPASFVLSVVDEAYFSVFPETLNAHSDFYTFLYRTGIYEFYYSGYMPDISLAEMGGSTSIGDGDVRGDFHDTATFLTGVTDASGIAHLSFKLPDNITSWRLTLAGISKQFDVGTLVEKRVSTLPFYGRLIMGETYVKGEKPSVMLRAGGADINWDMDVQYQVTLSNDSGILKTDSVIGLPKAYTKIACGDLLPGEYTLTVHAKQGSYKDALEHTFVVVDSKVSFSALKRDLSVRNFVLSNSKDFTMLSLWHVTSKALSEKLWEVVYYNTERLEWFLSAEEVTRLLRCENVTPDLLSDFIDFNGGVKPLINANSEVELTAKVAALEQGYLDKYSTTQYFREKLSYYDCEEKEVLHAFWGLASMGDPVLYELILLEQELITKGVSEKNRIILGNAYAATGAYNRAYEIYVDIEKDANSLDSESLLQLAYLGAQLGVESAEKWYAQAESLLPTRHTSQLLQLMYLKNQHKKLTPVNVQFRLDGKEEKVTINNPRPVRLSILPYSLFEFTGETDEVSVDENYMGTLDTVMFNDIPGYSITRSVDTSKVSVSGRIEVTIMVTFPINEDAPVVYETIPSGFSVVEPKFLTAEDEKMIFFADIRDKSPQVFRYTIRAKQEGQYILEPSIMTVGHTQFEKTEPIVLEVIQ